MAELVKIANLESSEQRNKWLKGFVTMHNRMGVDRAYFFITFMWDKHNERLVRTKCKSHKAADMPTQRLFEARAAYGLDEVVDSDAAREELIERLLSENGAPWTNEALQTYLDKHPGTPPLP